MKKIMLFILLFFFSSLLNASSLIDNFISYVEKNYSSKTIYVKIAKYGAFDPSQIEKLSKLNYSSGDILMLSAIFMYIDDDFTLFFKRIQGKNISEIISYYYIDENALLNTAKEILNTPITDEDIYDYDTYNKIIYFNLSTGAETGIEFSNSELSYFLKGGITIYPVDILMLKVDYKYSSIPIEDTNSIYLYNIKRKTLNFEVNITPIDYLNFDLYYKTGEGDYSYNYNMKALYGGLNFDKFTFTLGYKSSSEEYINSTNANIPVEFDSKTYSLELNYDLNDNSSFDFSYSYIDNLNNNDNNDFSISYEYEKDNGLDFLLIFDYVMIDEDNDSYNLNPDLTYPVFKYLSINLGANFNLYTSSIYETVTSTVFEKGGNQTITQVVKNIDTSFNYSLYAGLNFNF